MKSLIVTAKDYSNISNVSLEVQKIFIQEIVLRAITYLGNSNLRTEVSISHTGVLKGSLILINLMPKE